MSTDKKVVSNFVTPAFRLSYPALFEAVAMMGDENKKKFAATMLFPKKSKVAEIRASCSAGKFLSDDNLAGFYGEITKIARANFGPEVDLKTLKLPKFRDGDKPKDSGKIEENEKGYIVVKTTSETKPQCLSADKTRVLTDPNELYPGCWVRALLTIAPFVWQGRKGVTLYLVGIQKLGDDAAFSSRVRAEDEFDAVAGEAPVTEAPSAAAPWES